MKKLIFASVILFGVVTTVNAQQPFGPFNQQFTMNQQYGSTNWYSSPLGMGVAQAGVTLIGGLVNAMSRPDPVPVQTQQQQPVYVNGGGNGGPVGGYGAGYGYMNNGICHMQTIPNPNGYGVTMANVCGQ